MKKRIDILVGGSIFIFGIASAIIIVATIKSIVG